MDLKVDPKLPHHYIIGVGMKSLRDSKPGEIYLKYGPIYFTNADVSCVQDAKILSEDKLFKTSAADAISINGCSDLIHNLGSLKIAANANDCTIHHFTSEFQIDDESLQTLVNVSNYSDSSKILLQNSKIKM